MKSSVFDRGSDFGVKEFSFSFEGTNPATAKNDIKADLTLYFQSFKDFVEKKDFNDGKSYVELLLLPGGKRKETCLVNLLLYIMIPLIIG